LRLDRVLEPGDHVRNLGEPPLQVPIGAFLTPRLGGGDRRTELRHLLQEAVHHSFEIRDVRLGEHEVGRCDLARPAGGEQGPGRHGLLALQPSPHGGRIGSVTDLLTEQAGQGSGVPLDPLGAHGPLQGGHGQFVEFGHRHARSVPCECARILQKGRDSGGISAMIPRMRSNRAQKPDREVGGERLESERRRRGLMRMPGLRQQRELRCWTVAELARRAGVKWPTAAAADDGVEVSAETARKILLALKASPPSEIAVLLFAGGPQMSSVGPLGGQGAREVAEG
jgi:hypothetical protein